MLTSVTVLEGAEPPVVTANQESEAMFGIRKATGHTCFQFSVAAWEVRMNAMSTANAADVSRVADTQCWIMLPLREVAKHVEWICCTSAESRG